jgi:hypothetical protein
MNLLDKAIAVVAPQRARSRVALKLTQDYLGETGSA